MSSGDMYSEPSYDDVSDEVKKESEGRPASKPSSSSEAWGCIITLVVLVLIGIILSSSSAGAWGWLVPLAILVLLGYFFGSSRR